MYQPIPFEGYEGYGHVRGDCPVRWSEISKYLPANLDGYTFLDYGCAEGYFMFMALKQGASRATFIDHDQECLSFAKQVALEHGYWDKCGFLLGLPDETVDVGIYLDVHYNGKTPKLQDFRDKCETLFISPSGDGRENSDRLHRELNDVFDFVEPIYKGYESRVIFRCER